MNMVSTNYLFDPRDALVADHSFVVTIGPLLFSFSKVSNMQTSIEYDTITEGGNNDYPYVFQKPKQQPDTLVLEKGVRRNASEVNFDLLVEGLYIDVLTIMVMESVYIKKVFFFEKGIITKRTYSDLNAMGNGLFVASLEIAHTGLIELPV